VQASNPIEFDDRGARRAFEDGQSQQAIALMLAAGSPYVAQLNRQQARLYVEQTAQKAGGRSRHQTKDRRRRRSLEVD